MMQPMEMHEIVRDRAPLYEPLYEMNFTLHVISRVFHPSCPVRS
jgi:hypothetical protein